MQGFREQVSTITNQNGEISEVPWGTKGSRRADAIDLNSEQVKVVEVKNYDITHSKGRQRLVRNIRQQTNRSLEAYGDSVEITEVIDLYGQELTIADMEKMTKKLEEKVPEIDLDYRW